MSAALQAEFAAALLDPARPTPGGLRAWNGSDPARRFAVHRNNVVVSLVEALASTFPVLRRLVGEGFFDAMASVYVREHPPRSAVLAHYGEGLADWLAHFAPARALAYLPDMARLEFARVAAFHAADAAALDAAALDAAALAPHLAAAGRLAGARLALHPSCRLLRSAFAVATLWSAHQSDGEFAPIDVDHPESALVLRDAGDDVLVIVLPEAAAAFCAALLRGETLAGAMPPDHDFDLAATLALLLRHGAIVGWHPPVRAA